MAPNTNSYWNLVDETWVCPYCNRTKYNCSRWAEGKKHEILVYHHDHIVHYVDDYFNQLVQSEQVEEGKLFFLSRIKGLVQQMNPILICEDCNGLEAAIKVKTHVNKYLTLNIPELLNYVAVVDGKLHRFSSKDLEIIEKEFIPKENLLLEQKQRVIHGLIKVMVIEGIYWGPEIKFAYREFKSRKKNTTLKRVSVRGGYKIIRTMWRNGYSLNQIEKELNYAKSKETMIKHLKKRELIENHEEAIKREDKA